MTKEELETKMKDIDFPPNLDSTKIREKKKDSIFSKAIFTESFRSNRVSLLVVSVFNALIMVVIVLILSTLHMNSTKRALNNMFSSADMESTLKMGAISHYLGYKQTSDAIVTFDSSYESSVDSLSTAIDLADSVQMSVVVTTLTTEYDAFYDASTSVSSEERHAVAKRNTMALTSTAVNFTSYSEKEKEIANLTFGYILDLHHEDSTLSNKDLLVGSIPSGASDYILTLLPKDKQTSEKRNEIKSVLDTAFYNTYTLNMRSYESATLAAFDLIPIIIDSSSTNSYYSNLSTITDKLLEAYNDPFTKETFLSSSAFRREVVSKALLEIVTDYLQNFIYYSELPNFTVIYQTSRYGKPIYYQETNLVDSNGARIVKEAEADSYMPDKFIKVSEGMGINSNLLHKMNKEIITGSPYTEDEIKKAKEASVDSTKLIKDNIEEYLNTFINSSYFSDPSSFNLDKYVSDAVLNKISNTAEVMLIETYKEKTGKEIYSASEIGANELSSMSGTEMMNQIQGYIVSAMATYDNLYNNAINVDHRTEEEATLASVVHASQGVVDMLPSSVGDALTELGTLNSYGFFVGILAMGIACVLVPLVYNILLANSLVVDKVQSGSLAFVLSTPTNRSTFIFTEAVYLMFSQAVIFIITLLGCLFSRTVGIWAGSEDLVESLVIKDLLLFALGNFGIITTIASICFLTSCIFNKSKQSIGIGGGLNIFFFVATILGLFGTHIMPSFIRIEAMNIFNYMSIISLYDATAAMNGQYLKYLIKLLVLFIISGSCIFSGIKVFIKKDLPL